MIRRIAIAFVFVMGFLLLCGTAQQIDDLNVPEGVSNEAQVP